MEEPKQYITKNLYFAFKETGATLECRVLVNLETDVTISKAQKEGFKVVQVLYGEFLNLLALKGEE